jgi:hypothetical protein
MQRNDSDPHGARLPIKIDTTSNGEFAPVALSRANVLGNRLAHERVGELARRSGMKRRDFLMSSCGAASALLAFNAAHAAAGAHGGFFDVPAEAVFDAQLASAAVDGNEFVFDVQGHYVDPTGAWLKQLPASARPFSEMPNAGCGLGSGTDRGYLECLGAREFVKDVFLDSDTDMMVLSFVPSAPDAEPLTIEAADATRRIVDELEGTQRLMLHGRVNPNQPATSTGWMRSQRNGTSARGKRTPSSVRRARLLSIGRAGARDDREGPRARHQSGVRTQRAAVRSAVVRAQPVLRHRQGGQAIPGRCVHRLSLRFCRGQCGTRLRPRRRRDGIDTLVRSLLDNGIAPNSNVYAELGSTWRFLMRDPDSAAHALGKLFKYVGQDNVLWGTDSIWYGSPQDQIQAFRTFQIAEPLRETNGYPEITARCARRCSATTLPVPYKISPEEVKVRRGADKITRARTAYRDQRNPTYLTYGPKTRREFFNLLRNAPA